MVPDEDVRPELSLCWHEPWKVVEKLYYGDDGRERRRVLLVVVSAKACEGYAKRLHPLDELHQVEVFPDHLIRR